MKAFGHNPENPVLSTFLSYSGKDKERIKPLVEALQAAKVEVHAFTETERPAEMVKKWIKQNIVDADCLIFIISDASLDQREYVEREVGLAISTLTDKGILYPSIIPIQIKGNSASYGTVQFQPRDFDTKKPIGPKIIWNEYNCIMMDRDGVLETVRQILESTASETTLIKNLQTDSSKKLFSAAMELYEDLLPEERMRDLPEDIADWLDDTWNGEELDQNCRWINVLAVHHIGGKVIGLFWGSLHRRSGIGFVAFWGMMASHRRLDKAVNFFKEVLQQLRSLESNIQSFLFAAERVKWEVLDAFLDVALRIRMKYLRVKKREQNWHKRLSEPLGNQPSAIVQALKAMSEKDFDLLIEQLRCYRRFELFATGAGFKGDFERNGMQLRAFARKDPLPPATKVDTEIMADFVQPPIHTPVIQSEDSNLWLFGLMRTGQNLSPVEAINWFYDVYLKEFIGEGRTAILGWNEYMVGFKLRCRDAFIEQAELKNLRRVTDLISRYNILVTSVKDYWIHECSAKNRNCKWGI